MDAAEIARLAADRLHRDAVAAGHDPATPLAFARAEADRRGIDVYFLAQDHPSLKGGKAVFDHQAGHILVSNGGSEFERALLIAHEIGHVEFEAASSDNVVTTIVTLSTADAQSPAERVVDYSRRERREVRMNLFAREFLLPRSLMRTHYLEEALSRQTIAKRYAAPLELVTQQILDAILLPTFAETPLVSDKPDHGLDPSQQMAANQRGAAFQLQAGPGTGKTQTLVHHIDGLLREGIAPESILALTFSNKAAAELVERLQKKHPQAAGGIWTGTFHSFGLDIVRRFHDRLGLPEVPRLIDRSEAIELLEDELARLPLRHYRNLYDPTLVLADILAGISRAKDEVVDAATYRRLADAMLARAGMDEAALKRAEKCVEVAQVYEVYENLCRAKGLVDFGDLVAMPVRLLESDTDARAALAARHRHIIVDEYQDVNRASVRLLQGLHQPGNRLWVVGDARQAIYRFRGASSANMATFAEDFGETTVSALSVNYRSKAEIVSTFDVFAKDMATSKTTLQGALTAQRGPSQIKPKLRIAGTPTDEISIVAAAVEDAKTSGHAYRDQAILCASNSRLAEFAAGLEARGIPVLYLGSLFERPEIKALLALLTLLGDRYAPGLVSAATIDTHRMTLADVQAITAHLRDTGADTLDWRRTGTSAPGLSDNGRSSLTELADALAPFGVTSQPWEVLTSLVLDKPAIGRSLHEAQGVGARMQAIAIWQLLAFAQNQPAGQGAPVHRFLDRIRRLLLISDDRELRQLPSASQTIDAVHLMTIHGSKGLEFAVVHLPDLIVTKMPRANQPPACPPPEGMIAGAAGVSALDVLKQGHEEEQECVFFVALSRARDELHLSASSLQKNGTAKRNPSPYLGRIVRYIEQVNAPRAIAGPATASSLVPVTWRKPPALTDQMLRQYDDCPRRFFYAHVLKLGGRRSDTAFTKMHDVLQSVLDWLATSFPQSNPDAAGFSAKLETLWTESGPVDHSFATDYRRITEALVGYLMTARSSEALLKPEPMTLTIGQSTISVTPNHVVQKAEGSVAVRKVKTGRLSSDEFDALDYTIMLLAARETYGPGTVVEAVHLTSATTAPAAITDKSLTNRRDKAETILAELRGGAFPPNRNERRCPRCPNLFICGRLPDGGIIIEI